MYDIIGDVHGYSTELGLLLEKMGYQKRFGVYHHNTRKAIFLGDFVDRGPDVKGCLKMVKHMVEEGAAHAVLGNHEYNLVAFFTRGVNGRFLRPHSVKNLRQVKSSLKAFEDSQKKLQKYLDWFKTLPLFLELDGLRVIHATWDKKHISFFKEQYPKNKLSDELLHKSMEKGTKEHEAIESILKGVEVPLPKGFTFFDSDGNERKQLRIKWWESPQGKTFRDLAMREADKIPDVEIPEGFNNGYIDYPETDPPLFLGHYCLRETEPFLFKKNICCVDFCVVKAGFLTAYRWDGEKELDTAKFVKVKI